MVLAAWAADIAADLHDRLGADIDIVVGALRYPGCQPLHPDRRPACDSPLLPAELASVSVDDPVVVASGHDVTSTVRVHNHQDRPEMLATNGRITGRIINPRTGDVVGEFAGLQTMPLVTFEIRPHASALVPLLIGTASTTSELGYAVPAGEWAFDAIVDLDSGTYRTAPLPLTVT